jgi:hypothetical protein
MNRQAPQQNPEEAPRNQERPNGQEDRLALQEDIDLQNPIATQKYEEAFREGMESIRKTSTYMGLNLAIRDIRHNYDAILAEHRSEDHIHGVHSAYYNKIEQRIITKAWNIIGQASAYRDISEVMHFSGKLFSARTRNSFIMDFAKHTNIESASDLNRLGMWMIDRRMDNYLSLTEAAKAGGVPEEKIMDFVNRRILLPPSLREFFTLKSNGTFSPNFDAEKGVEYRLQNHNIIVRTKPDGTMQMLENPNAKHPDIELYNNAFGEGKEGEEEAQKRWHDYKLNDADPTNEAHWKPFTSIEDVEFLHPRDF